MNKIVIGILAHVDAGKTTLSESILYLCGSIRKLGRVDNRDTFLDTYELERARGITIFSKQAEFTLGEKKITLLDTPGHVDFSAEMERTLQVLDYAVLVISGADGVQGHTRTLWSLLAKYRIPTFVFVNKMDQNGADRAVLLQDIKKQLDESCHDYSKRQENQAFLEELAMSENSLLEEYLETDTIRTQSIVQAVGARKVFPCCFGSALKMTGIEEFLEVLKQYICAPAYPKEFGARVYKIGRDEQGTRLTYMKITGGSLRVKDFVGNCTRSADSGINQTEDWVEKADQIRVYSGSKYEMVNEAAAGTLCAVTGLNKTRPGEGLGAEGAADLPLLIPVLTYRVLPPTDCDINNVLLKLRLLEEEEPQLQVVWKEQVEELHVQAMGVVQTEVLKSLFMERFGIEIALDTGSILYKETIAGPVIGAGHFEPLRHYAEVHLLLEPGETGSGLHFETVCSEDILDRNWQRLILSQLQEKEHPGVLTGSPVTDIKITLIAGKAHHKHTEGGDFRQAAFRALRQGLRQAESILLEPYDSFRLEVPQDMIGRAMTDIQNMGGSFEPPHLLEKKAVLIGSAPVSQMQNYQTEVISYTRGKGNLFCELKGYEPCQDAQEVIDSIGYEAQRDTEHPADSIFCAHGAGYPVSWEQAGQYMHVDSGLDVTGDKNPEKDQTIHSSMNPKQNRPVYGQDEKELEQIFERTYGKGKQRTQYAYSSRQVSEKRADKNLEAASERTPASEKAPASNQGKAGKPQEEYLLVDGYNILFAWEELRELSKVSLDGARNKLVDILCNYQGFVGCTLILVFDAYKVKGNPGDIQNYNGIYVVYTKEAETADQYIEKTVHQIGRTYHVTVATSDALEQMIIMGQGAFRLSAMGLKEEIERIETMIREEHIEQQEKKRSYLLDGLSGEMTEYIRKLNGKDSL